MDEKEFTHISLFSGIGGFDLAAEWAGFRTTAMCEIDPFCQEVLKERFGAVADADYAPASRQRGNGGEVYAQPESMGLECCHPLLIPDIRDFDGTRFRGATLLTGGFPCQPFSHAGKRRGTADDRHLWPQMLRVITESRPRWVVAENVRGLINIDDGVVFEQVCLGLENESYEVQAFVIPACAVNAPHRRDRVWIIAHRDDGGQPPNLREAVSRRKGSPVPDSEPGGRDRGGRGVHRQGAPDSDAPLASCGGSRLTAQQEGREDTGRGSGETGWDIPWIEVATRFCRVDDGLPAWIHSRRVARLKALGNAIVPQVAYQIIKEISQIEKGAATPPSSTRNREGKKP